MKAHPASGRLSSRRGDESPYGSPIVNATLWIAQGLLALVFLFSGSLKLVMPLKTLTDQLPLPGPFVRPLGVAEVLGAIGLILPWLMRMQPFLTPLAAGGLMIIMTGATALTLAGRSRRHCSRSSSASSPRSSPTDAGQAPWRPASHQHVAWNTL